MHSLSLILVLVPLMHPCNLSTAPSVCSLTKSNATNHIYRLQIASSTPVIPRSSASMSSSHLLHKIKRVSHLLFPGHESPEKSGGNMYIYKDIYFYYLCLELFVYTYMYLILITYKASEDNPADSPCFQKRRIVWVRSQEMSQLLAPNITDGSRKLMSSSGCGVATKYMAHTGQFFPTWYVKIVKHNTLYREPTYPSLGKGYSISKVPLGGDMLFFQDFFNAWCLFFVQPLFQSYLFVFVYISGQE